MGDTATSTNGAANDLNGVIHAIVGAAIVGAETAAKAAVPWLAWPIVAQLFDYLASKFGDLIYTELATSATFFVINFQTAEEKSAYIDSLNNLQIAQSGGDADAIAKALQQARDNLGKLIHSDGSSTPIGT